MIKYAHILMEAANTPWAMEPTKLAAMVAIFRHAVRGGAKLSDAEISANIAAASVTIEGAKIHPNTDKSIANRPGGVALISLRGVLSNRAPMVENTSTGGGTNMERFGAAFRAALASDDIKAIILDVDSPGGSVFGTQEMADEIFRARGTKPMVAQVNALCASAAYWIASACDEIVVTPSGQVGSIGVYTVHEDVSKMYEEAGVKETLIAAGKYKVEGNPFEPLGEEARAAMQTMVDAYYDMFVEGVAQNRGTTAPAVRDGYGQGRCLGAATAISLNMADRAGTLADTLSRWGIKGSSPSKQARAENEQTEPVAEESAAEPAVILTPRRNIATRFLELNS